MAQVVNRKNPKKSGGNANPLVRQALVAGFVVLIIVAGYFGGKAAGYWGATVSPGTGTPTTMTFVFQNNTEVLDGNDGRGQAYGYIYSYEYDPDTFEQTDADQLSYADFTLDKSEIETGDVFTPAADTIYIMMVNCTGHQTQWSFPILGTNTVTLRTTPTNISLGMYDMYGSTTENQTNSVLWFGSIINLNSESKVDTGCGYDIVLDLTLMVEMENYEEDCTTYNVIVIDCNGTAIEISDVDVDGVTVADIQINSDKIEIYLGQNIYGKMDFSLEFDENDLGVDFEVESIYLANGVMGGSLTTLATA